MEFDALTNESEHDYHKFTNDLVREAANALRSALEITTHNKDIIERFLNRAYDAHLSPEEVTDLFCVSSDSVIDQSSLNPHIQEALTSLFDQLNTDEVRRRVRERTL